MINIGNSKPVKLIDFIETLEKSIGMTAIKNYLPLQAGDVRATWADTSLLESLTGYRPKTNIVDGVIRFVEWYRHYYKS